MVVPIREGRGLDAAMVAHSVFQKHGQIKDTVRGVTTIEPHRPDARRPPADQTLPGVELPGGQEFHHHRRLAPGSRPEELLAWKFQIFRGQDFPRLDVHDHDRCRRTAGCAVHGAL